MTCSEFRARIDGYAAGTLDHAEAEALEAHLESCAACEQLLQRAEGPLAETSTLPPAITPDVDLWPGIRHRLESGGTNPHRVGQPRWGLAAAAVVLVALSSGATAIILNAMRHSKEVATAAISPVEAEYAAASEELGKALEKARLRLSPSTVATIERNLGIIDAALAETRRALAKDPGNAGLEQLVVAVWRQKIDLLRRATAIEPTS